MAVAQVDSNVETQVLEGNAAAQQGYTDPAAQSGDLSAGVGDVSGETANQGLRLPRLQIAYGVGNLAKVFSPGDLVYGGDNLLAHKMEPIQMVIFKAMEYWREYMDSTMYDAGLRPRNFLTEAEVLKAGGITRWSNAPDAPKPTFSEAMDLSVMIKKPQNLVCGLFGIELEGAEYGVAVWTVDKSTYKRVAPYVKMCRQFSLRKRGLLSGLFSLHTSIETVKGRVGPVPNLKLIGHNSDNFIRAVSAMLGVPPPPDMTPELAEATDASQA